ncbi:MAG: hypothetical protein K6F30_01140 [Lachnospiraceae bacterium]|nr:hypothetical protein [Lachnospiraceae bacterium]
MNISGIRPYSGFYNVNNVSSVHNNRVDETPKTEEVKEEQQVAQISEEALKEARNKQTFGSYDYADQYRPTEDFEVKSDNSDLRTLDVEKAISDMRKDQAIQQYQFFVGENSEQESTQVRGAENFAL